jgi:Domain of unknown function (DUF4410)
MHGKVSFFLLMTAALLIAACSNVKVTRLPDGNAVPESTPKVIYVVDFHLDPESIGLETGILPLSPMSSEKSDESATLLPRMLGMPVQRTVRARELVNLMATTLVEDLRDLGFNAYRVNHGERVLSAGWLVSGSFIWVNQGNRLRRALIGFGEGGTELEVATSLSDLAKGVPRQFCSVSIAAHSSRKAGALISFDPLTAPGRFMLCGLDLDKNVMESADSIAREIAQTVQHRDCPA